MQINTSSPKTGNIKVALLFAALLIIVPTLLYTHNLVLKLQKKEREVAALYAKSLGYIANSSGTEADYTFIFTEIIGTIDLPIILTDASDTVVTTSKNIDIDSLASYAERQKFLRAIAAKMDNVNIPIKVAYQDTIVLSHLHYGESPLIVRLRWLPYIEIGIASLFILVGYIGFSYIKRSEQSNIWVGMARETAHQLGTPLTSMMGWIELLKMQSVDNPKIMDTILEFETDAQRLTKVADRFSKIGSKPDLKEENVIELIGRVTHYFEKRIPHMGKKVDIRINTEQPMMVHVNNELFEWVLENLIKNALDAIDEGQGSIAFTITQESSLTIIDIKDSGKGIDPAYHYDVFRPGFSTKKRGWGLGLSLAKRIIESYHKGKLFVKESAVGKGTTFPDRTEVILEEEENILMMP